MKYTIYRADMPPLGKHKSGKKKNSFKARAANHTSTASQFMEKGVNFESFSKAKYKEGTKYQCTNVAELCIFSVKSTLLAVSHPFQTSDRV